MAHAQAWAVDHYHPHPPDERTIRRCVARLCSGKTLPGVLRALVEAGFVSRHTGTSRPCRAGALLGCQPSAQQPSPVCIGGHGTDPYEQNTQQSPGFGLKTVPQPAQS